MPRTGKNKKEIKHAMEENLLKELLYVCTVLGVKRTDFIDDAVKSRIDFIKTTNDWKIALQYYQNLN